MCGSRGRSRPATVWPWRSNRWNEAGAMSSPTGSPGVQRGALALARDDLHAVCALPADMGVDQRVGAERLDQFDAPGQLALAGRPHHHVLRPHADEAVRRARPAPTTSRSAGSAGGVDHVHLRRADELRDELVGRPVVQLQRRADLLDQRRRAAPPRGRPASSPRPGRASRRSSSRPGRGAAWRSPRASGRAARRPGWTAARRTGTPWARARWRGRWPRAGAGRPTAPWACAPGTA